MVGEWVMGSRVFARPKWQSIWQPQAHPHDVWPLYWPPDRGVGFSLPLLSHCGGVASWERADAVGACQGHASGWHAGIVVLRIRCHALRVPAML